MFLKRKRRKTAIVVHIYHWDVWQEIATRLKQQTGEYDLYLSIDIASSKEKWQQLKTVFPAARIRPLPNKGMDILPFLNLMPELISCGYQQVLKLHTKKGTTEFGDIWRHSVLDSLLGDSDSIASVEAVFQSDPTLKLLGPAAFFLSGKKLMLANQPTLELLCDTISETCLPDEDWGFFAGSMFWSRPQTWQSLADWANQYQDLFCKTYHQDGLIVHAIERYFGLACYQQGNKIGLLHPSRRLDKKKYVLQITAIKEAFINQASSQRLCYSYASLDDHYALFELAHLINDDHYQTFLLNQGFDLSLISQIDLIKHYWLIGQFSHGRKHALAWDLHCQNSHIPWSKLIDKRREKDLISVIIPVYGQLELTKLCVKSLYKHTDEYNYEIILVDNGSDNITKNGLVSLTHQYPNLKIIRQAENKNFALGSNFGFAEANGEYCVFLNNDTQVTSGWLAPLIARIKQDDVYAAQPQLLYPDGTIQCIGVAFSEHSNLGYPIYQGLKPERCNAQLPREFQAITAACMAIKANLFAQARGFDPIYINGQEDIDLCLRLKALTQKKAAYVPESKLFHHESKTQGRGRFVDQNRYVFYSRWSNNINPDDFLFLPIQGAELIYNVNEAKKDKRIRQVKLSFIKEQTGISMIEEDKFLLKEANEAFIKKDYALVIKKLDDLAREKIHLVDFVKVNHNLAYSRLCIENPYIEDLDDIVNKSALIPLANVEFTSTGDVWKSTNEDPCFYVDNEVCSKIKPGFYEVELQVSFAKTSDIAVVYFDDGQDYNETNSFKLPIRKNKTIRTLIYFPKAIVGLRLDPITQQGEFRVDNFTLTPASYFSSVAKIIDELREKAINFDLMSRDVSSLYQMYSQLILSDKNLTYYNWIEDVEANELPSQQDIDALEKMARKPLFSVVMATYNTDERCLRECIDSVLNQSYSNLEFCIADDCSSKPHVVKVLDEYKNKDKRIKLVKRSVNGHISKATNSAIELVSGDYIVLLDHDDLIAKHALYFMAQEIINNPELKILYSDEDKIDEVGNRSNPHFKSDWNPDLFFSQNYVSHLGVYKTEIIKKIGGFRTGVEGSQDQDLFLRCLSYVKHNQIHHIPRVLYHWRMIEGSTALASGEKSYTTEAGIKALTDYFKHNGPQGITVEAGLVANTYKVNWPIPAKAPKVSLLIPTRDRKTITEVAVRSILDKTTYPNYEIVILDNGSVEPETLTFFEQIQQEDKRVSVLRYDHPFNYSAINNYGVKHTQSELVGLINNDIEVINPEWLTEMVSHAIRPDIGCVGAKLYYSNGQLQHAGVITGIGGVAGHSHKYFDRNAHGYFSRLKLVQNLSAVTAAVLLVRKEVYEQVNGLNEQDLQVAFNDVDFCLKVREAGYRNLWTPYAELYHHESISRGHEDTSEKQARFKVEVDYMINTWQTELSNDPYYSPNLTKKRENFEIGC